MSDKPKQPEMKLAYEESCSCCMKNEDAISTFILELSLYNKHRMYVDDHIAKVQVLEKLVAKAYYSESLVRKYKTNAIKEFVNFVVEFDEPNSTLEKCAEMFIKNKLKEANDE